MGLGAEDREERETAEPWNRAAPPFPSLPCFT